MKRSPFFVLFEWIRFRWWFARIYRVEISGKQRVPAAGAVILAANHESMLDPWLLGLVTPRHIRYMAKAELWDHVLTRRLMEGFGAFPVSRGLGDTGALGRGAQLIAEGAVIGIFPQGTCLPHRHRPWLRGAARLALATGTSIVPVLIVDSEKALRPRKFKVGLPRVRLIVCEPIEVEQAKPTVAAAKELTARIERTIQDARAPYGPPAHAWFPDERAA